MSRVLVVEDYPTLAKVMAIAIHREGFVVDRVGHIGRALETTGVYDIAVIDIDLPDGNGVDLAEQLVRERRVRHVVFYTSTRDASERDRARLYGPVIDKETGVDGLLVVIRHLDDGERRAALAVGGGSLGTQGATGVSGMRPRVERAGHDVDADMDVDVD